LRKYYGTTFLIYTFTMSLVRVFSRRAADATLGTAAPAVGTDQAVPQMQPHRPIIEASLQIGIHWAVRPLKPNRNAAAKTAQSDAFGCCVHRTTFIFIFFRWQNKLQ